MSISTAKLVWIIGKPKSKEKRSAPKDPTRRHTTLKELQEKKYLFPNSSLLRMFDDLLEKGIIQLPEL